MPAGRPPFYSTPEELQTAIDEYFADCDKQIKTIVTKRGEVVEIPYPKRYNLVGLNYFLGFSSHSALSELAKDKPEFSGTVTRARMKVEACRVDDLVNPDTSNVNGLKFDLTNNFGWKDKTEQDLNVKFPDKIVISKPSTESEPNGPQSN